MEYYTALPFVCLRIISKDNKILIGQHEDIPKKPYPKLWDMPGGKLEKDETSEEGAIREGTEETGLNITGVKLFDVFHHSENTFLETPNNVIPGIAVCYEVEFSGELSPTEMKDMGWVEFSELSKLKLTPWAQYFLRDLIKK